MCVISMAEVDRPSKLISLLVRDTDKYHPQPEYQKEHIFLSFYSGLICNN